MENVDVNEIMEQKKMDENRNCSDCIHHDLCKAFEEDCGFNMTPIGCYYYMTLEEYSNKIGHLENIGYDETNKPEMITKHYGLSTILANDITGICRKFYDIVRFREDCHKKSYVVARFKDYDAAVKECQYLEKLNFDKKKISLRAHH